MISVGGGSEALFYVRTLLNVFKKRLIQIFRNWGGKPALMSVLWISPIIIFANVSKYQIRFEELFKKIYIEYVINLLGVVCKSVVVLNVQILGNDIFLKHPIFYSKKIHNICMYIIITYGTLYCFWNNLYRGRHCIDNIMTLSDEMFEDFMWQGNNIDEPQNSRNGKKILSVNTIE